MEPPEQELQVGGSLANFVQSTFDLGPSQLVWPALFNALSQY